MGIGVSVLFLSLLIIALVVFIKRQGKKKKQSGEEKKSTELNLVYATYQIHDDPVAEVRAHIFGNFTLL